MRHYFMSEDAMRVATQAGAAVAGGLAYLFGADFGEMLLWIVAMMVTDHLVAIIRVLSSELEQLSRRKFVVGVLKKVAMILMFVPAAAVDRALVYVDLLEAGKHPTVALVVIGLLAHEAGSVVKNGIEAFGRLRFMVELLRRIKALGPEEGKPYGRRDTDYDQEELQ